jgi:pilus assembly protein TadC
LTPGFWLLLFASSPKATLQSIGKPGPRTAIVGGIVLQLLGAAWIGAIVRRAGGTTKRTAAFARVPVLRAVGAIVSGRVRSDSGEQIADAAETIGFVLDAGASPAGALERVVPLLGGTFGERLASIVARVQAGARLADSLHDATEDLEEPARRFADAFDASVSLGVSLAPALRALADDVRERTAVDMNEDVRKASIKVLVPLGLLILPAFVLSCLVPLFAGGLSGLSGS